MRATLRLGRVAGVPIGVNAGVLVILALVGLGLALRRFPDRYPGRPLAAYLFAALVAAVLFLASILVHELAHAVVAKANGIRVEGIILWLLGGVAELRDEPRSPGVEFVVAVVGPVTSFVTGLLFGGVAWALHVVGADGLVVAAAAYLAGVNVVLAAFNLVPAAPLDGGRVLRAAVWRITGDRVRAVVISAWCGRAFGLLLIVFGLGQLILGGGLAGLWPALIGWFLVHAAAVEQTAATLGRRLHGLRVADVMSTRPVTVPAGTPVDAFIRDVVLRQRFSTYPLVDDQGRLVGLATLNRIRDLAPQLRPTTRLVDLACAAADVPQARPDEPLVELLGRMAGCTDGRAVVVDTAGRVVGIVSPSDVSRALTLADLTAMDPYPARGADLSTAKSATDGVAAGLFAPTRR